MPGFLLNAGAKGICPHGGQHSIISTSARVLLSGQPVATISDIFLVTACGFAVALKPQPCVKVQWLMPASRVFAQGKPVILQSSTGICQSAEQIPQGPPTVIGTQTRVMGM